MKKWLKKVCEWIQNLFWKKTNEVKKNNEINESENMPYGINIQGNTIGTIKKHQYVADIAFKTYQRGDKLNITNDILNLSDKTTLIGETDTGFDQLINNSSTYIKLVPLTSKPTYGLSLPEPVKETLTLRKYSVKINIPKTHLNYGETKVITLNTSQEIHGILNANWNNLRYIGANGEIAYNPLVFFGLGGISGSIYYSGNSLTLWLEGVAGTLGGKVDGTIWGELTIDYYSAVNKKTNYGVLDKGQYLDKDVLLLYADDLGTINFTNNTGSFSSRNIVPPQGWTHCQCSNVLWITDENTVNVAPGSGYIRFLKVTQY